MPALERSISEIVRRPRGQPVQVIAPAKATALPVADLQPLPPEHRHVQVERLIREEASGPSTWPEARYCGPPCCARAPRNTYCCSPFTTLSSTAGQWESFSRNWQRSTKLIARAYRPLFQSCRYSTRISPSGSGSGWQGRCSSPSFATGSSS